MKQNPTGKRLQVTEKEIYLLETSHKKITDYSNVILTTTGLLIPYLLELKIIANSQNESGLFK